MLVHPDKNPGEAARQAFEALNEAHRELKDQSKLVGGVWRGVSKLLWSCAVRMPLPAQRCAMIFEQRGGGSA